MDEHLTVATSYATAVQHVGDHQSDRPEHEAGYEASRTGILFIADRETSGTVDASKNQFAVSKANVKAACFKASIMSLRSVEDACSNE